MTDDDNEQVQTPAPGEEPARPPEVTEPALESEDDPTTSHVLPTTEE